MTEEFVDSRKGQEVLLFSTALKEPGCVSRLSD
jgi:hypothetical protein